MLDTRGSTCDMWSQLPQSLPSVGERDAHTPVEQRGRDTASGSLSEFLGF